MNQEKYKCDICNYPTDNLYCYKRHMISQKHKDKQIEADKIKELLTKQIQESSEKLHKCTYCNKLYETSGGLSKHKKKCSERSSMQIKITHLEKEINARDNIIKSRDSQLEDKERIVCELIKTLEYERIKEKSHLSASNYLSMTYNSAPNMKLLSDFAIFKNRKRINNSEPTEGTDEDLLEIIINAYQNDHLVEFIGGALVSYYKTENPQDQCIWNSDTERLTYFIRRNFNWKIDKKGIKTETLIIAPALSHFYDILQKVVTSEIPRRQNVNIVLRDNEQRQVCYDIMLSIENGSLSGKILKFMAPYLFLDKKLKYIEAQTDIPPTKCIQPENSIYSN